MTHSRKAYLVYLIALLGVLLSVFIRETFDGVAFIMVLIAGSAFFIANHLEKQEHHNEWKHRNDDID